MDVMGKTRKFALWTIITAAVLFGAYYLYEKWWGNPEVPSVFGMVRGIALEKISAAGAFIKEKTGKTFEKAAVGAYSYAKKASGGAIASLGGGLETLGERLASTTPAIVPAASSSLPVSSSTSISSAPTSTGFFLPPPTFAISGRPRETLLFSLNREGTFMISWGDGSSESVSVGKGEARIASHAWGREGDFAMSVVYTGEEKREEWKLFVRIH